jgi:hypothetical protein
VENPHEGLSRERRGAAAPMQLRKLLVRMCALRQQGALLCHGGPVAKTGAVAHARLADRLCELAPGLCLQLCVLEARLGLLELLAGARELCVQVGNLADERAHARCF